MAGDDILELVLTFWVAESKNEKFMAFEGLSDDEGLAAEGEDGDELDDEEEDVGMTTT